jgi:starvation-inducible outer membrane lipoprotein
MNYLILSIALFLAACAAKPAPIIVQNDLFCTHGVFLSLSTQEMKALTVRHQTDVNKNNAIFLECEND